MYKQIAQPPGAPLAQLPAHRTSNTAAVTSILIIQALQAWRTIYLSDKELELLRQNPRARVEVVLLWKQVLHDSQRSAQSDFTHHLRHAWGEEKP